jgi:hypothetical protein
VILTRRQLLARGAGATAGLALARSLGLPQAAAAAAPAAPEDEAVAFYLTFMDTVVARVYSQWSETYNAYRAPGGTYSTVINARMLQVHATAAAAGHTGASRDDERTRQLVATLLKSPVPYRISGANTRHDKMFHLPGWITSLTDPEAVMDKAVDPQVAQALTEAWRAGAVLGLEAATLGQIVDAVSATARCAFFRYPGIRLNQLNWNCALYALDAELTGATDLLRGDYREQMLRFATFATRAEHPGGTPNLGPGWHFDYLPNHDPSSMANLDSAEYANETLDCVRHYATALAAGMTPLPAFALDVFRAYAQRTLYGDWMHSGYLNWDTGLGSQRRYIGKVFAFAQQGLMALATSPMAQSDEDMGAHARWLFDRGLDLYLRWLGEGPEGSVPPPVQFGDLSHPEGPDDRLLFAARMASNAAQAITLGLASVIGTQPPPMYSFDPDSQRLAVSTPAYASAILVHNRHAVSYGGLDPNRLFDGRGQPVGCTAGSGIANFIACIRDRSGRVLLSTQMGEDASMSIVATQAEGGAVRTAIRSEGDAAGPMPTSRASLLSQSAGSVLRAGPSSAPYPRDAYAGPMHSVQADGRVTHGAAAIATSHLFLADTIRLDWELRLPAAAGWEVALPSYGPLASPLVEGTAGQTELTVGGAGPELVGVREILMRSEGGSYAIAPLQVPSGARLRAVHPPSDSGAARPGPTLLIDGPALAKARSVNLSLLLRVA